MVGMSSWAKLARPFLASFVAIATLPWEPSEARRLVQDGAIEAHVFDGDWCAETVHVEVRAPSPDVFAGNAFQIRRLAAILSTVMPLECPQARTARMIGAVGGQPIWQGVSDLRSGDVADLPAPGPDALIPLDERERTRRLQAELNALGYDAGPPDGLWGPRTRSALEAFQLARALPVTARPGPEEFQALRDAGADYPRMSGQVAPGSGLAPQGDPTHGAALPPKPTRRSVAVDDPGPGSVDPAMEMAAVDLGRARGFPVLRDRLVVPGSNSAPANIRDLDISPELLRLAASSAPDLAASLETSALLMDLLPEEQRRAIFMSAVPRLASMPDSPLHRNGYKLSGGGPGYLQLTEFDVGRVLEEFRERGMPQVIGDALPLPLPLTIACSFSLPSYDFQSGSYPLSLTGCRSLGRRSSGRLSFDLQIPTQQYPDRLVLPPQEAEDLRLRLPDGTLYAGVDVQLNSVWRERPLEAPTRFTVDLTPERLALFEDETLTREIASFDLATEPRPLPQAQIAINPNRIVLDQYEGDPVLSRLMLAMILERRPDVVDNQYNAETIIRHLDDAERGRVAQAAGVAAERLDSLGQVDEFDRRRIFQALREHGLPAILADARPLPIELLLTCRVPVGPYDFERAMFPFRSVSQGCTTPSFLEGGSSNISVSGRMDFSGLPEGIPVPMEDAEAFVAAHLTGIRGQREASIGVEFAVVGMADQGGTGSSEGRFNLQLAPQGLVLFSSEDETRSFPIRRLWSAEIAPGSAAAQAEGIVTLDDPETLMLIMLGSGLHQPTDQQWRQWAGARAYREHERRTPNPGGWPRFFQGLSFRFNFNHLDRAVGDDLIPGFREWTTVRAGALPGTVRATGPILRNDVFDAEGSYPSFRPSRSLVQDDLADQLNVPQDRLLLFDLSSEDVTRWDVPVDAAAVVLPVAVDTLRTPVDPAAVRLPSRFEGYLDLALSDPRLVTSRSSFSHEMTILLLEGTPVGAGLQTLDGDLLSSVAFDMEALTAPPSDPFPFPPLGYTAVLQERYTGEDAVESLYAYLAQIDDPFERRRMAEELVAEARAWESPDGSFWITGRLRLGDYDFEKQLYATPYLVPQDYNCHPRVRNCGSEIRFDFANIDDLVVRLPPAEAQRWQGDQANFPSFVVRLRIAATGARDLTNQSELQARILEFQLLDDQADPATPDPSAIRYAAILESAGSIEEFAAGNAITDEAASAASAPDKPAVGTFDILGVRLGMAFEAAQDTVSAAVDDPVIYFAKRSERIAYDGDSLWDPFNEGVLVRAADGNEAVALYQEPPAAGGRVTAASRWVHFPSGNGPPSATLRDLLIDKYGPPFNLDDAVERVTFMYWTSPEAANSPNDLTCDISTIELRSGSWRVDRRPWIGPDGPLAVQDGSASRMSQAGAFAFENSGFFFQMQPSVTQACGETLVALIVAGPDGRASQFLTGLSDPAGIADLVERNRLTMMGETASEDDPTIDLKL